jgi:hypothetical protein
MCFHRFILASRGHPPHLDFQLLCSLRLIETTITDTTDLADAPVAPEPSTAEVRAWARGQSIAVPDRGKLRPEVWDAWQAAHQR